MNLSKFELPPHRIEARSSGRTFGASSIPRFAFDMEWNPLNCWGLSIKECRENLRQKLAAEWCVAAAINLSTSLEYAEYALNLHKGDTVKAAALIHL